MAVIKKSNKVMADTFQTVIPDLMEGNFSFIADTTTLIKTAEPTVTRGDSLPQISPATEVKTSVISESEKKNSKWLTALFIGLSLWYPLMIVGLPLLALFVKKMKTKNPELAEKYLQNGEFWGKFSSTFGILGLLSSIAMLLLGLGSWPLILCSLAISGGLISLIFKPKKNKKAILGLISGGIPILAGIIFILIFLLSGFGP